MAWFARERKCQVTGSYIGPVLAGLLLSLAWLNSLVASGPSTEAGRQPNVVFLFADDMGYGDLGSYGNTRIKTPNIDRLAIEGVRFTSFYAAESICTPSRYGLITGRYPRRAGGLSTNLFPNSNAGLGASEVTLADLLRKQGYATACVGKWHLGGRPDSLPTRHGFDRYFGIPYSHNLQPTILMRDDKVVESAEDPTRRRAIVQTLTRRYTEEALRFIEDSRGRPFFLYLPYSMPHVPFAVSDGFKPTAGLDLYGAVIEELDWSVGAILSALKRAGLDSETLVIFSSDNGAPDVRLDPSRSGGLRGAKGSPFEGGLRIPCLARWPGKLPRGRVEDRPAMLTDWLPTLVRLAGGQLPTGRPIDGRDIGGLLTGTGTRGEEPLWWPRALRLGSWKLIEKSGPAGFLLFNLDEDRSETKDLSALRPDVGKRMRELHARIMRELKADPTASASRP